MSELEIKKIYNELDNIVKDLRKNNTKIILPLQYCNYTHYCTMSNTHYCTMSNTPEIRHCNQVNLESSYINHYNKHIKHEKSMPCA